MCSAAALAVMVLACTGVDAFAHGGRYVGRAAVPTYLIAASPDGSAGRSVPRELLMGCVSPGSSRAGGWLPGATGENRGPVREMLWEMAQPQHASKDGEG